MNPLKNYCFGFWDILTATFLEDEAGPNTSVNAGTYLPNVVFTWIFYKNIQ